MTHGLVFVVGALAGLAVAGLLMAPSSCCARVAAGVRSEVEEKLGGNVVAVGDALGVWKYTPGLLDVAGVD
jgi:hypothetical protein